MCKFCTQEHHVHSSTMCQGGCDCERLARIWSQREGEGETLTEALEEVSE